jgi:uncharacterized membrane protein YphA (DoxX/SURF4 family)
MRYQTIRDPKTISLFACVFLVLLRLSIGWQFVWEGLWKLNSQSKPVQWSAVNYLNNAQGPYREYFRNLIDDPNELRWLDYDYMSQQWDHWAERFTAYYGLSENQQKALKRLIDGPDTKVISNVELPNQEGSDEKVTFAKTPIKYDPQKKTMSFSTSTPPIPKDFARIYAQLGDEDKEMSKEEQRFRDQLRNLQKAAADLSYRKELAGRLKGDPGVTGVVFIEEVEKDRVQNRPKVAEEDHVVVVGDKQVYLDMLADYNEQLAVADQDFEFDHLQSLWKKIQQKKNTLVAPIKELDKELKQDALKLLTYEQLARGPLPPEKTRLYKVDQLTIWSLLILGGCLLVGFCTRLAALAGAGMLISFYLVWPPWPGVPEAPGPEHALFVNKNIIEAIALMAIVFMPTSAWFGLDGMIGALFKRKRK